MTWSSIRVRSVDLDATTEITWALSVALLFTVVRWIVNRFLLGRVFVTQEKDHLSILERMLEEVWLAICALSLLLASWMTFLDNDVGASIFNTHPMIRDWPMNSVSFDVIYLFRVHTGWYIHQMTRGWTASGVPIDAVMFYHHVGTLLIIIFGELTNLLLAGVLALAVFNISNPFLHVSKMAHTLEWKQSKQVLFCLFGFAFFVSRIVMLPLTVMKIGYIDAYKEDYKSFGEDLILLGNVMLLILYGLQIFWMLKILKVIWGGRTGATPKKSSRAKNTVFSKTRPLNGKDKEN
eukprot:g8286.t1